MVSHTEQMAVRPNADAARFEMFGCGTEGTHTSIQTMTDDFVVTRIIVSLMTANGLTCRHTMSLELLTSVMRHSHTVHCSIV